MPIHKYPFDKKCNNVGKYVKPIKKVFVIGLRFAKGKYGIDAQLCVHACTNRFLLTMSTGVLIALRVK